MKTKIERVDYLEAYSLLLELQIAKNDFDARQAAYKDKLDKIAVAYKLDLSKDSIDLKTGVITRTSDDPAKK